MKIKKMQMLMAGTLVAGGLLFSGCSGQDGNESSDNDESGQESMEQSEGSSGSEGDDPPQFNQGQNTGGDSVTDKMLEQFTGAMDANRQIQQDMMPQMEKAVKDAGLSMEEYQEINRKQRGPGQGMQQGDQGKSEISEDKLEKFKEAQKNLKPVQEEMRSKMEKAIEEEGLSMQEYQRILRQIRQDRELQNRMRKMQQDGQSKQRQRQPKQ